MLDRPYPRTARPGPGPLEHARLAQHLDHRGRGRGTDTQDLGLAALAGRHHEPHQLEAWLGRRRRADGDRLAARPQPAGNGGIAREVQAFLHSQYRGQGHDVDVAASLDFLLAAYGGAVDDHALQARDEWAPQCARVAHALGRPFVTGLKRVVVDGASVRCEQEVEGGRDVYVVPLPAVLTVKEGLNLPRYPSVPGRMRAGRKPVAVSTPATPEPRLELVRLVVPAGQGRQAEVLGVGAAAAPAVVEMLRKAGVL